MSDEAAEYGAENGAEEVAAPEEVPAEESAAPAAEPATPEPALAPLQTICADDWPPPLAVLSKLHLNSQNEWAFAAADFSGKELKNFGGIENMSSVVELDVSDNKITSLAELSAQPGIRMLRMDNNAVVEFAGLTEVTSLRKLIARNNRVQNTAGLPPNVVEVDISGNPVLELAGLDSLANLKKFTLKEGRLSTLAGASAPAMEEMNVECNAITTTEGIEGATGVKQLHLRGNKIAVLSGFGEGHEQLKSLDLRDNELGQFQDLEPLATAPALSDLKLSGNPICKLPCFKQRVVAMLPFLTCLDEEDVTREERVEAEAWWKKEEARLAAEAEAAEAE